MSDSITTLSVRTRRELADMLADWRTRRELRTGEPQRQQSREGVATRWARTTTDADNPVYPPAPANKIVVEFGDFELTSPDAVGYESLTFTAFDPQETRVAICEVGWLPENTVVQVSLVGGRWWILDERYAIRKAVADGAITAGTSGSVTVQHNSQATSQQVTARLDWMHGGRNVASGDELVIRYFRDQGAWVIIEAECT